MCTAHWGKEGLSRRKDEMRARRARKSKVEGRGGEKEEGETKQEK